MCYIINLCNIPKSSCAYELMLHSLYNCGQHLKNLNKPTKTINNTILVFKCEIVKKKSYTEQAKEVVIAHVYFCCYKSKI